MVPKELPMELRQSPFTLEMATAWGLTTSQLQRMALEKPFRGVHATHLPATAIDRARAFRLIVPSAVFSHVTAAELHGLPIPEQLAESSLVHVIAMTSSGRVRRKEVVGHTVCHERQYIDVLGLRAVALADTWVDFGELIRPGIAMGLDDLIILGDAVANRLGSVSPLLDALERRVRPRGKLTLLEALPWIRVGSESPGETRLRLALIRCGLPEPLLNVPVRSDGLWLGRPDLQWPEQRVIGEYQGLEFHGSETARANDRTRFGRFAAHGWRWLEVWADDLNTVNAREATMATFAEKLGVPKEALRFGDCHPKFFGNRMLELAELRLQRLRLRSQ